jgi:hypothetical protein
MEFSFYASCFFANTYDKICLNLMAFMYVPFSRPHLEAGGESVGHGAEEHAGQPRLPGRAAVAQVVQQGQEVEVLEVAEHRLDPG